MIKRVIVESNMETREFTIDSGSMMDWESIGLLEVAKAFLIKRLKVEEENASTDTSS